MERATLLLSLLTAASAVAAAEAGGDVLEDAAAAMMALKKAEQPVLYQALGQKSLKCWQCAVTMGEYREGVE